MPKTWAEEYQGEPELMAARRQRGTAMARIAGSRQPREADITRTQRRYRQRRAADLQWAISLGVSTEFIATTGVQYVRGE